MTIYLSEQARQYREKRLDEFRREMEAELAAKEPPMPPKKINFLPVILPPPGSPEHIRMYDVHVLSED